MINSTEQILENFQEQARENRAKRILGAWLAGNLAVERPASQRCVPADTNQPYEGHISPDQTRLAYLWITLQVPIEQTTPRSFAIYFQALRGVGTDRYVFSPMESENMLRHKVTLVRPGHPLAHLAPNMLADVQTFTISEHLPVQQNGLYHLSFRFGKPVTMMPCKVNGQMVRLWLAYAEGVAIPRWWDYIITSDAKRPVTYEVDMFEMEPC